MKTGWESRTVQPGEDSRKTVLQLFSFLEGTYEKDGRRLPTMVCSDRTRGNGFKLKEDRFRVYMIINFF